MWHGRDPVLQGAASLHVWGRTRSPRSGRQVEIGSGDIQAMHSFRTLLGDLATLTRNTVCFGGRKRSRFTPPRHMWASGAKTDRAELGKALAKLDDGLMVIRRDRLARSTRDLLNTLASITYKRAGFRVSGPGRHLGRYYHITRTADADRARRPSGV
jgi:hypothetical protein